MAMAAATATKFHCLRNILVEASPGVGCSYGCGCIKCQPEAKGADVWLFVLPQCLLLPVYRSTNSNNSSRGSNKILMLQLQRNAATTLKVSVTFYAALPLLLLLLLQPFLLLLHLSLLHSKQVKRRMGVVGVDTVLGVAGSLLLSG